MVIDEIYELGLLNVCHIFSSPTFDLKGKHSTSASKPKSVACVLHLGPNIGLPMEFGGDISADVASISSN